MKKTELSYGQLVKRWIETFAGDVPKTKTEKHLLSDGCCIWHLFTYGLIGENEYFSGDKARKEFDRSDHSDAEYMIFAGSKEEIDSPYVTAEMLDRDGGIVEACFVGRDWRWTYIITHENGIGPFFYRLIK
ncbi:MAG: DUF4275 family protein [Clostridia bacterium]|nr:DUF4275 family protein [Clostridia bacterium]